MEAGPDVPDRRRLGDALCQRGLVHQQFLWDDHGRDLEGADPPAGQQGPAADPPLPERVGGIALPLYTGYDGIGAVVPKSLLPAVKSSGN